MESWGQWIGPELKKKSNFWLGFRTQLQLANEGFRYKRRLVAQNYRDEKSVKP